MLLHSESDERSDVGAMLAELLESPGEGHRLRPQVLAITHSLGFDSFSYRITTVDPSTPYSTSTATWTTLPDEWVSLYERKNYSSIDPRVINTRERTTPYIWDAASGSADWRVRAFLRDAAAFGICSGVAVSLRDPRHARAVVALNSQTSPISAGRRRDIQRALGEVMLFAVLVHDVFIRRASTPQAVRCSSTVQLSLRERQCLQMAARGMTSADIGVKLGITPRTANFHFSNVISKLGVVNRHEAIARAVSTGLI